MAVCRGLSRTTSTIDANAFSARAQFVPTILTPPVTSDNRISSLFSFHPYHYLTPPWVNDGTRILSVV